MFSFISYDKQGNKLFASGFIFPNRQSANVAANKCFKDPQVERVQVFEKIEMAK